LIGPQGQIIFYRTLSIAELFLWLQIICNHIMFLVHLCRLFVNQVFFIVINTIHIMSYISYNAYTSCDIIQIVLYILGDEKVALYIQGIRLAFLYFLGDNKAFFFISQTFFLYDNLLYFFFLGSISLIMFCPCFSNIVLNIKCGY